VSAPTSTPLAPPSLLARVAARTSQKILLRALDLVDRQRVRALRVDTDRIDARVLGSGERPYAVTLRFAGDELEVECACPFDWEPICKHAAAAALAASDEQAVEALAERLGGAEETDADRAPPAGDRGAGRWGSYLAVREHEIEVRLERGRKEEPRIRRLEGGMVFGRFRVAGEQGAADYEVQIRDLRVPANRCTCPDFQVNMLGTCKHIEAVLQRARARAPHKFDKLARMRLDQARVVVRRDDHPRVALLASGHPSPEERRIADRFFDAAGVLAADPRQSIPAMQAICRGSNLVTVDDDVLAFLEQVERDDRARQRDEQVRREISAAGARLRGFRGQLYPYQVEGAAFLAGRGSALLADDMGLGKTVQAIAAALHLRSRDEVERVLLVCPASLKHQWEQEIRRFSGAEPCVVWGAPKVRRGLYRRQAPFTIVNYELVIRDLELVRALDPDLLILDEAQRIKNWRTKTATRVKQIPAQHVFVLTGTPLENRLDDLYSLMQAVEPRILGPLWAFNQRFFKPAEGRGSGRGKPRGIGHRNLDELRRRLRPVVLRRTRDAVLTQLPERIENRFYVELTAPMREFHDEAVQLAAMIAARAEKRPLTPSEEKQLFAAIQRARMACNSAWLVDNDNKDSPKLDELTRIFDDLAAESGRKVVVFSEWERMIRLAADRARELELGYELLCGAVPSAKRGALLDRFRSDPDCRILFSTDAGGVGLNLQCADTVVNLELPFNPARLDQRIARVHRLGQKRPVHVLLLIAERSIESGIERVLVRKKELFHEVLAAGASAREIDSAPGVLRAVRPMLEAMASDSWRDDETRPGVADGAQEVPVGDAGLGGAGIGDEVGDEARVDGGPSAGDGEREGAGHALVGTTPRVRSAPKLERQAEAPDPDRDDAARALFRNAHRKLAAARALVGAGIPAEAFGRVRESLETALRAVAAGLAEPGSEQLPATRLLHEVLVPKGLVSFEGAGFLASAVEVERAYGASDAEPPAALVEQILERAEALLADLPDGPRAAGGLSARRGARFDTSRTESTSV